MKRWGLPDLASPCPALLFGEGLEDVVEAVGGVGDAFELRILFAVVVVEGDGLEVAGVFDDEVDGRAIADSVFDGGAEQGWGKSAAVDGVDLEAGGKASFVSDAADNDVADVACLADRDAEREGCVEAATLFEL